MNTQGFSIPGSEHCNQDAWGWSGQTAWVIDGATRESAAENEYVATWVCAFNECLKNVFLRPNTELLDGIHDAIANARITANKEDHPSAALAIAQRSTYGFSLAVLGDSAIWSANGQELCDTRLKDVAPTIRHARMKAKTSSEYMTLTRELLREEDKARNTTGGFWVAGYDPEAAFHALTCSVSPGPLLLMTDGITDHLSSPSDLFNKSRTHLRHEIELLRKRALAKEGRVDDMTLVLFE